MIACWRGTCLVSHTDSSTDGCVPSEVVVLGSGQTVCLMEAGVSHRAFLVLWLLFLPAAFVAALGWYAIPISIAIGYELLGYEVGSLQDAQICTGVLTELDTKVQKCYNPPDTRQHHTKGNVKRNGSACPSKVILSGQSMLAVCYLSRTRDQFVGIFCSMRGVAFHNSN